MLDYRIRGDIDRPRLPPQAASKFQDLLWSKPAWKRSSASPTATPTSNSTSRPRASGRCIDSKPIGKDVTSLNPLPPPRVIVRRHGEELEADIDIHLGAIPGLTAAEIKGRELRLAVSAVMQSDQGVISYWALAHPPGKPDFHHRDGFALRAGRRSCMKFGIDRLLDEPSLRRELEASASRCSLIPPPSRPI